MFSQTLTVSFLDYYNIKQTDKMKKRIFLALISVLIYKLGMTQSRFGYSFDFEPIYSNCSYKLKDYNKETNIHPSGDYMYDNFKDYYEEVQKFGLGFGFSFGFSYNLTNKLIIKTGFGFKKIREKLVLTEPIQSITSKGKSEVSNLFNSYNYLTIPVEILYNFYNSDDISIYIIAGSDIDLLINYSMTNRSNKFLYDPKSESGQVSSIALNLKGGLGINYKFNDNISIFIQPEFARYITPNIKYNSDFTDDVYCKINQYNYYGQIRFGININK